ncbi:MAG: hypothetical protein KFB97_00665 [Cyanobium sp. M30B3]|nr:MAG: hypothetical protein KFB97_00665 [Cyanobium sp. M30B3]
MAFPGSSTAASAHGLTPAASPVLRRPATSPCAPPSPGCSSPRSSDNDHQLEKLEFALAVAITRGDLARIQTLREQIAALGGNCEEPGT